MKTKCAILILSCFIAGCASTKYAWNGYDNALYRHYKNPAENDMFMAKLKKIVDLGEKEGKVPPGIYAEYGYVLYENKQYDQALVYFTKEYEKWPESRVLMQRMIDTSKTMIEKNKTKETPS
jgi:hypothetical protein